MADLLSSILEAPDPTTAVFNGNPSDFITLAPASETETGISLPEPTTRPFSFSSSTRSLLPDAAASGSSTTSLSPFETSISSAGGLILPSCSRECIIDMQARDQGCYNGDPESSTHCLCNRPDLISTLRECSVEAGCNEVEQAQVIAFTNAVCISVGNPLDGITASSTTSLSTQSSTSRTSIPSDTSPVSPTQPSSSLSTGAKAGIGIGVVVGALIVALLVYIAILLRKRAGSDRKDKEDGHPGVAELGSGITPELAAIERPGELEAKEKNDTREDSKWDWGQGKGRKPKERER